VGCVVSIAAFGVLNYRDLSGEPTCWDCFHPYGVPFTLFRDGGFAGGGGIVWTGLAGNLMVATVFAVALAWLLDRRGNFGDER
jgi:hypothetical protein